MKLCRYDSADTEALTAIYREAISVTGAEAYDTAQVEAWAALPESMAMFRDRLSRGLCLVAEIEEGILVGFGQLDPPDHIAFLYTSSICNRQGIGSAIYQELEHSPFRWGVHPRIDEFEVRR